MKVVLWKQEALETREEYRVRTNLSASDALGPLYYLNLNLEVFLESCKSSWRLTICSEELCSTKYQSFTTKDTTIKFL